MNDERRPPAPAGFAEFVSARYPALVRYGALLTGDRGHGEDLAQDALVKTYRAWRRLHPHGDPEAYTRQVMVRAAWRAGRRMWRFEIPAAVLPDRPAGGDFAERQGTADVVLAALRALPAAQRVVLVLRYWAGLSESEIAAQVGCSTGTVKSRAGRAIAALRRADGPLADAFTLPEGRTQPESRNQPQSRAQPDGQIQPGSRNQFAEGRNQFAEGRHQ